MASRLTWIVFALAFALYGIATKPLILGLDLKGGVTMRYQLDPPEVVGSPDIPLDDVDSMIDSTVDTLRGRINEYGIRESAISRQGEREIVIELPGSSKDEAESIKSVVSRVGRLEFRIVLTGEQDNDARAGLVYATELERLSELLAREEYQGRLADEIDLSELDLRTPDVIYRWYAYSDRVLAENRGVNLEKDDRTIEELLASAPLTAGDFRIVKLEQSPGSKFTGGDILRAQQTQDGRGNPAVGIYMNPARAAEFGDWTEPNQGRSMGMLLDGRLAESPATINDRLEQYFVIQSGSPAGFSSKEIKDYLTVIKSGSLQMKPKLLFENTIGPSLGETAIDAGITASLAGLIATALFMILYYRANGVIAALCLVLNLTMLTGVLMFLGATLTLPGIAGLVLTIGMAVDANILVFERIREESDRAKSVDQAVRLGFEKAFSTIIDANVTTFVTAFILYKVGTGPVRGFSVILMLGIATSVFSVLVAGRLIYDWLVERGWEGIGMGRLIKGETHVPFMKKARVALRVSAVLVLAGLTAFFTADRDKYGLDFLGGYKAQVRLSEGLTQGEMSETLAGTFEGAQVVSVTDELDGDRSRQFVIKVKADPNAEEAEVDESQDLEARYELPLKAALADKVLPDFVTDLTLSEDTEAANTKVAAVLHFEETDDPARTVTPEKVAAHLAFLTDLETRAEGGGVAVSGTWTRVGLDAPQVVQRLRQSLAETTDLPAPSEPFLESTTIGSRVGTELRDSAIRAMLLSFIAIVLYIRVRFREYRYGIAAIIALFHDVSITLGIVALMHFSGIVDVEIDLAMIAAFLTIVGYSLNDTIVVFDRIRENLPRMAGSSLSDVIDTSVNQTLSRTLLTSGTTLVSLLIIFGFNYGKQNVLEGFSFAMIIGVLVGTYSSIFVASPVLVLLADGKGGGATEPSKPVARGKGRGTTEGVPA